MQVLLLRRLSTIAAMNGSTQTVTGLKRWSCIDKNLPELGQIKAIHIYDFDNTLFCSPLPNKQIWNGPTLGQLQALDHFTNGGWWHDSNILAATGKGAEEEEARAWEGWWNESIVDLVRLTMQQPDALNVLLTGRKESAFSQLILRMLRAKQLDFDMVCLKPEVGPAGQKLTSTMMFKQELLKDLVFTYSDAEEVRIYEDRPRHTKAFRDFFNAMNHSLQMHDSPSSRMPFVAEVIQVSDQVTTLDPVTEVAAVQRMINSHNAAITSGTAPSGIAPLTIKRTVFYTGYLISPEDTERLTTLVPAPQGPADHDLRHLANNILITPRPAPPAILDKVGGIGKKLTWRITGLAAFENKLWAARVAPVIPSATYYSENPTPTIVLALRRNARPVDATRITNWQPVAPNQAFEIDTVVGEKVLLRVEEERAGEDEWESKFPRNTHGQALGNGGKGYGASAASSRNESRKHLREDDFPPLGGQRLTGPGPRPQGRSERPGDERRAQGGGGAGGGYRNNGGQGQGRGGRGGHRGGGFGRGRAGRGGAGRGRGRGGQYRSLDDNGGAGGYGADGMQY